MAETSNKTTALNNAVSQIEKQFGKGSILRLGSKDAIVPVSASEMSISVVSIDSTRSESSRQSDSASR